MGLKERIIKKQKNLPYGGHEKGFNAGLKEAAQLAQEADALMEEMVKVLAGIDPDQLTDDQALTLTGVLDRYTQYKEQTNEQ